MWSKILACRLMRMCNGARRLQGCISRRRCLAEEPVWGWECRRLNTETEEAESDDRPAEPLVGRGRRRKWRGWQDFPFPGAALEEFRRGMDDVFVTLDRRFGVPRLDGLTHRSGTGFGMRRRDRSGSGLLPAVDVREMSDKYLLVADVPGMTRGDISVKVGSDRVLTIKGGMGRSEENAEGDWVCRERVVGGFVRAFRLPDTADVQKIKASVQQGVLTVEISKMESAAEHDREITVD